MRAGCRLRWKGWGFLLVLAIWITYLTLQPFWIAPLSSIPAKLAAALRTPVSEQTLLHVPLFLFFGAIVSMVLGKTRSERRTSLALLGAFCLLLETLQVFSQSRHPRLGDLLTNAASCTVGLVVGWRAGSYRTAGERWLPAILAVVFVGNCAFASFCVIRSHTGTNLSNWAEGFPLIVGNEWTGDRPWLGTIRGLSILPFGVDRSEVAQLLASPINSVGGRELRRRLGAVAIYSFNDHQGGRFFDASTGEPLDLVLENPKHVTSEGRHSGLVLAEPNRLASFGPANKVSGPMRTAEAFTVEVVCSPANVTQGGPARIVSMSTDTARRNFTIGQEGSDLVVRVRTPNNGPNGSRWVARWSGVFTETSISHIVAVFDRGRVGLFVDGRSRESHRMYSLSSFFGLRDDFGLIIAAAVLFFPMGGIVTLAWPDWTCRRRTALSIALGVAPAGILDVTIALAVERQPDTQLVFWAAAWASLGVVAWDFLGRWSARRATTVDSPSRHAGLSGVR